MTHAMRLVLEIGPKGKKVVAVAPDWPGLARGAKNEEAAVERLLAYMPRYAPVARLAAMEAAYAPLTGVEGVERYAGTGFTDFWGISFGFSSFDHQPTSDEALEHHLALLRASWTFFDTVRGRVSAGMQRGPRGGGRDRVQIVRHTLLAELDWTKKLGLPVALAPLLTDEGLDAHRNAYCDAIRTLHGQGKMARTWPLRYLIWHTAFHSLDHAWEMEDKDLTDRQP